MQCSMVPYQKVEQVWPKIEDFLEGAAAYTYGRYTVEDIKASVLNYGNSLWIAFDDDKIYGSVVTNFITYPQKKFVSMSFCGGVELHLWKDSMLELLRQWAFNNQCDGVEATARIGWSVIFKNDGHKALWQTFELPPAEFTYYG